MQIFFFYIGASYRCMARNQSLLQQRNQYIKERYRNLKKKNPKWRYEALVEEVSKEVFLSPIMVVKILKQDGEKSVPHPSTIYRNRLAVA